MNLPFAFKLLDNNKEKPFTPGKIELQFSNLCNTYLVKLLREGKMKERIMTESERKSKALYPPLIILPSLEKEQSSFLPPFVPPSFGFTLYHLSIIIVSSLFYCLGIDYSLEKGFKDLSFSLDCHNNYLAHLFVP